MRLPWDAGVLTFPACLGDPVPEAWGRSASPPMISPSRRLAALAWIWLLTSPAWALVRPVPDGQDALFLSGATNRVSRLLELRGRVRFEADAVIELAPGAGLVLGPDVRIDWEAEPYRPIRIQGAGPAANGQPTVPALDLKGLRGSPTTKLHNLVLSDCPLGIRIRDSGDVSLWHVQWIRGSRGLEAERSRVHLRNILFLQVEEAVGGLDSAPVDLQQATVAACRWLNRSAPGSEVSLLRSLVVDVEERSGFTAPPGEGTLNLVLQTPWTNILRLQGGTAYLPEGSRRARAGNGHASLDPELASILPQMTVHPPEPLPAEVSVNTFLARRPIRDEDLPEVMGGPRTKLGFHHWPVDYVANGTRLVDATLTLGPGVVAEGIPNRISTVGAARIRRDTEAEAPAKAYGGPGDSDGDGVSDEEELAQGTPPGDPEASQPRRLAVFGFDRPDFATEDGLAPLPGSDADLDPSFDRTAAGFRKPGQVLLYPARRNEGKAGVPVLPSTQGTVRLDYSPDWYHGRTNDAPGEECVLVDSGRIRISIDPGGRQLRVTRSDDFSEQTFQRPLPRAFGTETPFMGRTNWTLQVPFGDAEFTRLPKKSLPRRIAPARGKAVAIGNLLEGGLPARGRIDRVEFHNRIPTPQVPLPDGEETGIRFTLADGGIRLRFERGWQGDWEQGAKYPVERREIAPGNGDWATVSADARTGDFLDSTAKPGTAYRYRITTPGRPPQEGSVNWNLPAGLRKGRVLLLVDQEIGPEIADSVAEYRRDLLAEGWEVLREDVPRHVDWVQGDWTCAEYDAKALAVNRGNQLRTKDRIRAHYEARREDPLVAVLIGHVPVPYSGWAAEDGHVDCKDPSGQHLGAWNADVFYGDMTDGWTDNGNFRTGCPDCPRSQCTFCTIGNVPGDGRWDQNELPPEGPGRPPRIEVPVGRIDFARLNNFEDVHAGLPGNPKDSRGIEVALLRRYFGKIHRHRTGDLRFQRRAEGYAGIYAPAVELNLRSVARWLPPEAGGGRRTLQSDLFQAGDPVLWGFHTDYSHFGVIGAPGAAKAGHSHFSRNIAWQRPGDVPRAALFFSFGSFQAQWFSGYGEDVLRTCLASRDSVLVAGCAVAFTPWITDRFHAGAPVATLLQDSTEHHGRGNSRLAFLLGDPLLVESAIEGPSDVRVARQGDGIRVSWKATATAAKAWIESSTGPDSDSWTPRIAVPAHDGAAELPAGLAATGHRTLRIRLVGRIQDATGTREQASAPVFVDSAP